MKNCFNAAKALDELMLELIEKGIKIPRHVADDLKAGRSLASIGQRSPDDVAIASKALAILENVEMNLLSIAEAGIGGEYADGWQGKIAETYQEEPEPVAKRPTFVAGVPKGDHWVRIETKDLFEVEGLEQRLGEYSLTIRKQDDGFTLIHGKKEDVTGFLREIREEIRQRMGKGGV